MNVVINENSSQRNEQTEQAVLFIGCTQDDLLQLAMDAHNCVVLDRSCSSTVCGQLWMNNYLYPRQPDDRTMVRHTSG